MKNSEIHQGLDKQEIREYLSRAMNDTYKVSETNPPFPSNLKPLEYAIKTSETIIEEHLELIKVYKKRQAITILIEQEGWSEHDVSDETINDIGNLMSLNFVGTETEYNSLISKIEEDLGLENS